MGKAPYYSFFYFGGSLAEEQSEVSAKDVSDNEVEGTNYCGDDEVMFGKDRRPSLLSRNLRLNAVEGDRRPSLSAADLPPFKKGMKCYIDGCKKTFNLEVGHTAGIVVTVCVTNKHVSATKVPMELFGYAKKDGEKLFEKVCVKCYDDAMAKNFNGGRLSAGKLLCYLKLFRDRSRYLRVKKGLKAVKALQAIIRGDRCRIDLTWRDVGLQDVVKFVMSMSSTMRNMVTMS